MKPVLKVAQIAAFQTNIGDNANLNGTRKLYRDVFSDFTLEFSDIDIVNFSFGISNYDDDLKAFINQHDILLIGGGGFLEIIPGTQSWTGTRINMPKSFFDDLDLPIVLQGVGMDTVRADLVGSDYSAELSKLATFLDYCKSRDNIFLSTRHDGALHKLSNKLGSSYANQFSLVGDGGFFVSANSVYHPEIVPDAVNIAINLGGDLLEARFPGVNPRRPSRIFYDGVKTPTDYESSRCSLNENCNIFLIETANVLRRVISKYQNVNFIFVPHIFRDIEQCFYLISELGFPASARNCKMAPFLSADAGSDYIIDLYSKCNLVMGMRFHANICDRS